jgi:hypothetical protein
MSLGLRVLAKDSPPHLAALIFLTFLTSAAGSRAANVEVYVAYAENEHLPQVFMPNPWYGSPNTLFVGYPTTPPPAGTVQAWDTGGILIRNTGTTDIVLGPGVSVDGFKDPAKSYTLWDTTSTGSNAADGLLGASGIGPSGMTIHPGQQLILAQTGASRRTPTDYSPMPCNRAASPSLYCWSNFDTSDTPTGEVGAANTPVIHLTLNGIAQTFIDTAQILNTAGSDLGNHTPAAINESVQWRLIGTTGTYLPGGTGVNPPAVTTWHNDNSRTGLNSSETTLNPQSVNCLTPNVPCNFGKLFVYPVDGKIWAQPLFVPNVVIGGATHNVVIAATDNNSVYAFDAESAVPVASGEPLWMKNFGATGGGGFAVFSTPVIDPSTNTLYVVTNSNGVSATLHALDLSTGNDKINPPPNIAGSVYGIGDGSVPVIGHGGVPTTRVIPFSVANANSTLLQRPALLLYNGSVYVAFGSNGDNPPYHGWIFGYSAANISLRTEIYNSTPNATSIPATQACSGWNGNIPAGGAFWMTGAGPAADSTGIFATTANGTVDTLSDHADSILRLIPPLPHRPFPPNILPPPMRVADYFTPYNQADLNCNDADLGSSGPLLVPNSNPPLLVQASKLGTIYLINRTSMGNYHPQCTAPGGPPCEPIVQVLNQAIGNPVGGWVVYSSPAYFNNTVFYKADLDFVKALQLVNGQFSAIPVAQSASKASSYATPSISYDSSSPNPPTSSGIVWTVEKQNGQAVLHAYSSGNLQELYNSNTLASDAAGPAVDFTAPPTVAAGKVFVGAVKQLVVYGAGLAFPLQTDALTVNLRVLPLTNHGKFDVLVDGARQLKSAANGATTGPLQIAAGAYAVSISPSLGTNILNYTVSFTGTCNAQGLVTLQPGSPATCTILAQAKSCPAGEFWNPAAGKCEVIPKCPANCKNGCYLPVITPSGPVWNCKPINPPRTCTTALSTSGCPRTELCSEPGGYEGGPIGQCHCLQCTRAGGSAP